MLRRMLGLRNNWLLTFKNSVYAPFSISRILITVTILSRKYYWLRTIDPSCSYCSLLGLSIDHMCGLRSGFSGGLANAWLEFFTE